MDGISDQSIPGWDNGFSSPSSYFPGFFQSTWVNPGVHIRYARFVVQWNVMYDATEKPYNEQPYLYYRQQFEQWLSDAGGMGLTLELAATSYTGGYPSAPSEYRARLRELLNQALAEGHPIRYLEAWNEPNGQGGYRKVSEAGIPARYDNEAYSVCEEITPKCTIVAGNVEDNSAVTEYLQEYRRYLSSEPKIWGVHPYWSVEYMDEKYYKGFLDGLPGEGVGDQIWFSEVAARKCTGAAENGVAGQAQRASWLVNMLMPYAKPEHVFYWEFLLREHKQPTCAETDDALYVPSGDPTAPDAPRPAAAFIYASAGFPWGYTGTGTIGDIERAGTLTGSKHDELWEMINPATGLGPLEDAGPPPGV